MKTLFAVFVLLLLSATFAYGQNSDWEVVVYAPTENAILILTPNGIRERLAVPVEVEMRYALSPDHRYFAVRESGSPFLSVMGESVRIADLVEQSCCLSVVSPETELAGLSHLQYSVAAFNPHDSSQLALFYRGVPEGGVTTTEADSHEYGLLVVNVKRGEIIAQHRLAGWAHVIGWREAGILWAVPYQLPTNRHESDMTLAPVQELHYEVWNPATNVQGRTSEHSVAFFDGNIDVGKTLELTGEHVVSSLATPESDTEVSTHHFVLLYQPPDAEQEADAPPQIIYDGGQAPGTFRNRGFGELGWAADGNAIYLRGSPALGNTQTNPDTAVLLLRDGSTRIIDMPHSHLFLTGTPDGWLLYSRSEFQRENRIAINHYRYVNGEVEMSELAEFVVENPDAAWSLTVLQRTPLGATAEPTDFPAIQLRDGLG